MNYFLDVTNNSIVFIYIKQYYQNITSLPTPHMDVGFVYQIICDIS